MDNCVAFIVSNSWCDYPIFHGDYNGYVAVPPTNKYHGKPLDEMDEYVNIHGGLSFSEPATNGKAMFVSKREYKSEYVGKPCGVLEDAEFITENTEIVGDWWIFGFDTFHFGDNPYRWGRKDVIEEALRLKQQLEETKCCGNCRHFKDEDISGKGWCSVQKEEAHCGFSPCEEWEGKENEE